MNIEFDTRGNPKQLEAAKAWLDPTIFEILYGGAKYGAKSNTGCNLIFGDAMIYPNTRYFIARDSLTDLRRYTIPSIYEVFEFWKLDPLKYFKYNGQDNYFLLYNKSVVEFIDASYSPSDPDFHGLGSRQFTRGWCEEIGDMHPGAITNLSLTVGRWKNREYKLPKKLLLTCNPHKGYGYQEFYKPHKAGTLPADRVFISALPSDNKAGDPEYIKSLLNLKSKNERERLAFGNWEYDDDPAALMEYEKILDIFTNKTVGSGRKVITADIARYGGDKIVVMQWDGFRVDKIHVWQKQSIVVTTEKIEAIRIVMGIEKSDVIVDEDGVGGGVVDGGKFIGFKNGSVAIPSPTGPRDIKGNPIKENFDNLKSQCYFRLADRINKNGLYLVTDRQDVKDWIIEELEQVKQKMMDSDMKKGVVKKEDVKSLLGRSPDFSDTIMMREYFELLPAFKFNDAEY